MKNIMEKIATAKTKVNKYYDLKYSHAVEITKQSERGIDESMNFFYFGYLQGMKAAKAGAAI